MPNYRSHIPGGFFVNSESAEAKKWPVSIRANNPGAINGAAWEKQWPGYVKDFKYDRVNNTTIFETPEDGVAVWYELMRKYRASGADTIKEIIWKYGGGQENYKKYGNVVAKRMGVDENTMVVLEKNDSLLPFARAMFKYEAGKDIPWTDTQILYGFELARAKIAGKSPPLPPESPNAAVPSAAPSVIAAESEPKKKSLWDSLAGLLTSKPTSPAQKPAIPAQTKPVYKLGDTGEQVKLIQHALADAGYFTGAFGGNYGSHTEAAVRAFQVARNLDPDGEVGKMTWDELFTTTSAPGPVAPKPDMTAKVPSSAGTKPSWYANAEKEIGFKETGNNRGIERFIAKGKTGSLGDPWCSIFINAMLESAGVPGSKSAMARSFERHSNFVKLAEPIPLGAIVTMWRGSPSAGTGHVFLFDGVGPKGIRGIGGNESDGVRRSFHDKTRIVGYYWPKLVPVPKQSSPLIVSGDGSVNTKET